MKGDFYVERMNAPQEQGEGYDNMFDALKAQWPELIHAAQNGSIDESEFHPVPEETTDASESTDA